MGGTHILVPEASGIFQCSTSLKEKKGGGAVRSFYSPSFLLA